MADARRDARWIIYGAYGYTGRLLAAEAARRGLRPILAGRSASKLRPIGESTGLDWRAFSLDDPAAVRSALAGVELVLHAAGPFGATSRPMLDACIAMGTSYADIAGELDVYEEIFARDEEARRAGIAVVPGIGFDIIPTDCLAVRAAAEMPGATMLELAVGTSGGASGGTLRATVRMAAKGGLTRRDGELRPEAVGAHAITSRFPASDRGLVSLPLSDLVSAWHSTGIPTIRTYVIVPAGLRAVTAAGTRIGACLPTVGPIRGAVDAILKRWVDGPDDEALATSRTQSWVRVRRGGESLEYLLEAPGGYAYTQEVAITAAMRLLEARSTGKHSAGVRTPGQAFGSDFIFEVPKSTLWRRRGRDAWKITS